jgi:hypothetical protein
VGYVYIYNPPSPVTVVYCFCFLLVLNKLYPLHHLSHHLISHPIITPDHLLISHHIKKLYRQPSSINPLHQMPSSTHPKNNSNQGYNSLSSTPRNASIDSVAPNTTAKTTTKKWLSPIVSNLLKITPEPPINPWAADPFSRHQQTTSKEESQRASLSGAGAGASKGDFRPDQRRGYLGRKKVVGWVL